MMKKGCLNCSDVEPISKMIVSSSFLFTLVMGHVQCDTKPLLIEYSVSSAEDHSVRFCEALQHMPTNSAAVCSLQELKIFAKVCVIVSLHLKYVIYDNDQSDKYVSSNLKCQWVVKG
jgi:hypothetical protein